YSLGCSFYYLLSGQPPFAGGSLMQKLLKHREAEPPALQSKRADLPPALWPVLQKMLAKKPEERYRTPASVAAALSSFARGGSRATMSGMSADKLKPTEPGKNPDKSPVG